MLKTLLLLKVLSLCLVKGQQQHPNILFIMVDDLRPALGCYGDQLAITPSLDALSIAGVTFSSAYAQEALCGPSRTSLLTSRRPDSTCIVDAHHYWRDYHNFTTLPQHFKEHGYYTASAGKIFHPGRCSNYSDDSPYSWSAVPYHPSTQQYKNSPVCGVHRNMTSIVCPVQLEDQPEGTLPDLQTTHFAISFLQHWHNRRSKPPVCTRCGTSTARRHGGYPQPFFLAVGYHKPHIPLKFPRQFLELFPLSSVPLPPDPRLPEGLPPVAYNPWNDLRWRDDVAALNLSFPFQAIPDHYSRMIRQAYYAATAYTDLLIGDLLSAAYLLHPDTLVVVMGDHGWSLGEHQEWSKFSNYEVATRVPLIVAPLSRYPAAKRALLADKSSAKYFRYKKYVKLQKKLLKDVGKWAGKGVHGYSQHWVHGKQAQNVEFEDKEALPFIKNNNHAYFSLEHELPSRNKNSEKRKKCLTSNRNRVLLNDEKFLNSGNKLKKLKQRRPHHSYNLARVMKSTSRANAHQKIRENGSNKVWLNLKRNFSYDGLVELLDVFPTLADLAGISQVPSCDSYSRIAKFRSMHPRNFVRKQNPLKVLNHNRRRSGEQETRWNTVHGNNFLGRYYDENRCGHRKPDFRVIFMVKLCAVMKWSSKMLSSAISASCKQTNDSEGRQKLCCDAATAFKYWSTLTKRNSTDTVRTLGNVAIIEEYFRKYIFGHQLESTAESDEVPSYEGAKQSLSPHREGHQLQKKRHLSGKPSRPLFRPGINVISTRELRLCTEGQSLVPFIVEQMLVDSNSTNYSKHASRNIYFRKNKLTAGVSLVWNHTDLHFESQRVENYAPEDAKSRSMFSLVLQPKSNITVDRLEGRSNAASDAEDYSTWTSIPGFPNPASLVRADAATVSSHGSTQNFSTSPGTKHVPDVLETVTNAYADNLSCMVDVVHRRVAISQYPRPSFCPSQHPDSDQPKLKDIRIMGYSLRSRCFRYTLWVAYNSSTQTPDFDEVVAEELYDHRLDPREDHNLLQE